MATVADIVIRALRRLPSVVDAAETPSAEDEALGVQALNDMLRGWVADGVDCLMQDELVRNDTFVFFVPPKAATAVLIDALSYVSTWDASANSPALASSSGTKGYVYRVSTAGSTTLDSVTSWAAGEFAVFDGAAWVKAQPSRRHEAGVIAMLAVRLAESFGVAPGAVLARDASNGWTSIQADFIVPAANTFDIGIVRVPSRRYGEII